MTAKAIFELNVELRQDQGRGASRRLRRTQDKVPAILYGGGELPLTITLDHKKLMHALEHQAFYSHILTLHIQGKKQQAILKDVQRHPFKKAVLHLDFQRVKATDHIHMHIPLQFTGEANCPGVKAGGIVSHRLIDIEVRCLASALPEFIEVDVSNMELDQTLHLSDLKIPKGVELVALSHGHGPEHNYGVVSIHLPRRPIEEETPVTVEGEEGKVEPEVALKGKQATAPAGTQTTGTASTKEGKEKGKAK